MATALSIFAKKCNVSLLNELVASRQGTLGDRPFATVDSVAEYGTRTQGTLIKLLINELARNDEGIVVQQDRYLEDAYKAADIMGAAIGIITLLRYFHSPLVFDFIIFFYLLTVSRISSPVLCCQCLCVYQTGILMSDEQ